MLLEQSPIKLYLNISKNVQKTFKEMSLPFKENQKFPDLTRFRSKNVIIDKLGERHSQNIFSSEFWFLDQNFKFICS